MSKKRKNCSLGIKNKYLDKINSVSYSSQSIRTRDVVVTQSQHISHPAIESYNVADDNKFGLL